MRLKKLLAMLLTVVLLVSSTVIALPVSADGNAATWVYQDGDLDVEDPSLEDSTHGTKDNPYLIKDAQDLATLAYKVNKNVGGKNTGFSHGVYFEQTADIDLQNIAWPGIGFCGSGTGDAKTAFRGIYDGQGYAIKNLKIDDTYKSDRIAFGLFGYAGYVDGGGIIKNVNIVSGSITATGKYVGALVGYSRNGLNVSGCSNMASVKIEGSLVLETAIGGLIGYAGCSTTVPVNVENSFNGGDIEVTQTANNNFFVGGLIATTGYRKNDVATDSSITVQGCLNYGDITVTGTSTNDIKIGGIVGALRSYAPDDNSWKWNVGKAFFKNNTNLGDVTLVSAGANSRFGGLIGWIKLANKTVVGTDGDNTANGTAEIAGNYDSGVLTAKGFSASSYYHMGAISKVEWTDFVTETTKENYVSTKVYLYENAEAADGATADKTWDNKVNGEGAGDQTVLYKSFTRSGNKKNINISALSMLPTKTTNVQYKIDNEVYCIRFSSELNLDNLKGINDIGFFVDIDKNDGEEKTDEGGFKLSGNKTVYSSLNALNGEQITPEGVGYIIAAGISNVPETGTVTFKVTPYVEFEDGTVAYGTQSKLVTVENGGEPVVSAE